MKEVRKPGFLRAIPILITVFSLSFPAYAQYSGGTGEPNDPYQIATAKDLMLLGDSTEDYDKHFIMIDDIDLDPNLPGRKVFDKAVIAPDVNSVEDGFQGTSFNGVFDGNGHIISHLTIEGKSYLGLFGLIDYGATVKNMSLNVIDVNGTGFNVGGLVGQNNGKIEDCYISGIVSGQNAIGGLVGSNSDMPTLVMHSEYTGGGILTNCYSTGVIRGKKYVGGLVGYNSYGTITDCHSTASMMGTHDVGGLVGWNFEGKISGCSSSGNVQGISETTHLGGLVGTNNSIGNRAEIINCYSCGDVSGETYLGGLVGGNSGGWGFGMARIINCYSTGTITGIKFLGGLVGSHSTASIVNCYATGRVNGVTNAGGLVGENMYSSATITSSLWDIETSGRSNMCGSEVSGGSGCDDVNGKTTAEMQMASTFLEAGWDFVGETENGIEDIWWIDEGQGYPRLWWEDSFFLVVDDFESYNDLNEEEPESNLIWNTWIDGFDNPEINGSVVGGDYWTATIVHSGNQSMPFYYNNAVGKSEATFTLTSNHDWTIKGLNTLTIWFRGNANNPAETMYVVLNGSAAVNHDNPNATQVDIWMEWRISLREFYIQGVNLANVNSITLGFGNRDNPQPGGSGLVYFDDIRLYRSSP
jgi:hypothetical protein